MIYGVFDMNWRLASVFYAIASTVMMGVLMVAALVLGYDDAAGILVAVLLGLLLALPITYAVTKALLKMTASDRSVTP